MKKLLLLLLPVAVKAQEVCPPPPPSTLRLQPEAAALVPILHSKPTASYTIFLDFDGGYYAGQYWDTMVIAESGMTTQAMAEAFAITAEDYSPWIVDITTDSTKFYSTPVNQRSRIYITTTSFVSGAGGIAYTGSFGGDIPGFTFSNRLSYLSKFVGESVSHEAGHQVGNSHQAEWVNGVFVQTYHPGFGPSSSPVSWAPIMGNSYQKQQTTWSNLQTSGGQFQSNIEVISSFLPVEPKPGGILPLRALVHNLQVDSFYITSATSTAVQLRAVSEGNTDIMLEINGMAANGPFALHDTLVASLNAGTNLVKVSGVDGPYSPSAYGSTGMVQFYLTPITVVAIDTTTRFPRSRNTSIRLSYDQNYIRFKSNKYYFYTLFSISGQVVKKDKYKAGMNELYIGNLPKGMYILVTEFSQDKIMKY